MRAQPVEGALGHHISPTLVGRGGLNEPTPSPFVQALGNFAAAPERQVHLVVVGVESLSQIELRIEHERCNERRRRMACFAEAFGQRDRLVLEEVHAVVVYAVMAGVGPGHDGAVGRQGRRDGGEGALEERAFSSQLIKCWGRDARIPVAVQPVRSHCVERHEQHVAARNYRGVGIATAAKKEASSEESRGEH